MNKGDQKQPKIRSRLVAEDFRTSKEPDLYAGTPPLEYLKLVIAHSVTGGQGKAIMLNDIRRAFLHSPCRSEVYVQQCEEDKRHTHRTSPSVGASSSPCTGPDLRRRIGRRALRAS